MNEPLNDSPKGDVAVESASRRTSFVRVLWVLALTVVVFVGVRLAAPVLNPVFFAVVLSLLFGIVLSGVAGFLSNLFLILMIVLFLLAEGPVLMDRLRASAGEDHPQVERLASVGQGVVRQFGLRAILNLVTAIGVTALLLVLGVDFALMWGILTFFLSFVPYVGLVLAAAPPALLALAEFGVGRALHVIAGVTVVNILAENVLSPMMSRGLSISPTSPRRAGWPTSWA